MNLQRVGDIRLLNLRSACERILFAIENTKSYKDGKTELHSLMEWSARDGIGAFES